MVNAYQRPKKDVRNSRGAGAYILATLVFFTGLVIALSYPVTFFTGKVYVVGQGTEFFSVLVGGIAWSVLEIFTDRGKGAVSLILRFLFSFIPGAIIGYLFGALSNVGSLLLVPASQGNGIAAFAVVAMLYFLGVVMFTAAFLHNHRVVRRGKA